MKLLFWSADVSTAQDDVFLAFIPMFHVYIWTDVLWILVVVCWCYDIFDAKIWFFNPCLSLPRSTKFNIPTMIHSLVKYASKDRCDLSSLRRVGRGAAPLSKGLHTHKPWWLFIFNFSFLIERNHLWILNTFVYETVNFSSFHRSSYKILYSQCQSIFYLLAVLNSKM